MERRKPQESGEAGFAAELAGAAGLLPQPGIQLQQPQQQSLREEALGKQALSDSAEKSPLTMKPAVSLNTAAMIAGPKPWSREWVFEGVDPANPEMKPLLQGEASPKELMTLQQAAQELQKNLLASGGERADANALPEGGALAAMAGNDVERSTLASIERSALGKGETVARGELQKLAPNAAFSLSERSEGPVAGQSRPGGLSGSEFLNTLSMVRGGQDARQNQSQGQMGGNGEQSGRKAGLESGLRVIEGGLKSRKGGFDDDLASISLKAGGLQNHAAPLQTGVRPTELTGHVVPGAMAQNRLSSESLLGLSSGIRNLSPNGGGEIRMKLNPGNLGELHLRITTLGNQVGLQIQASDDKARKIIEDSIGFLKESLATHQLNLGQIDVSVAQTGGSQGSGDFQQNQQPQHHAGSFSDLTGQNPGRNQEWSRNGDGTDAGSQRMSGIAPGRASASAGISASRTRSAASNGRLDVMA